MAVTAAVFIFVRLSHVLVLIIPLSGKISNSGKFSGQTGVFVMMAAASTRMRKPVLRAAVFRGRERASCTVAKMVHSIS